jgi:hypothetical protein
MTVLAVRPVLLFKPVLQTAGGGHENYLIILAPLGLGCRMAG